jgi:DNA-binding GntR family transcriptional regulator
MSTKADSIAEKIRARIKTGRYEAGQRLTLTLLSEEFGCSHSTLLIALMKLRGESVIHRKAGNAGYFVSSSEPGEQAPSDGTITCPHCKEPFTVVVKG